MKSIQDTEVLVLGAGPVGMFSALWLSERGVRVTIVDKYQRLALHSYALALHPLTLRMLDELGLAESLVERGNPLKRIVVHENETRVAEIELSALGGSFPMVLVLPQLLLEGALEKRLEQNGVQILWGHQLLTFDDEQDAVTALIGRMPSDGDPSDPNEPPTVSTSRIRASFLIAADGCDSLGRRTLGVECRNVGSPIHYALLEFQSTLQSPDEMSLVIREESTDVLWPIGADRGRWSVQLQDPSRASDVAGLKELIGRRAPWLGTDFGTIEWLTSVSFQRSLAERFGRGRVWLAGDAAHFTSPIGVQSMNVGLHEAYDLARRMADILQNSASLELLRYYNEERSREWKMLLGLKNQLRTRPDTPAWAHRLALRLVPSLPASGRDLNALLEQVGLRLHWLRRKTRQATTYQSAPSD
jgi:2-polyprenyl-6-methoxyphenol hydroxylase-like FAD-dependent oxidoreductase